MESNNDEDLDFLNFDDIGFSNLKVSLELNSLLNLKNLNPNKLVEEIGIVIEDYLPTKKEEGLIEMKKGDLFKISQYLKEENKYKAQHLSSGKEGFILSKFILLCNKNMIDNMSNYRNLVMVRKKKNFFCYFT